ncbi:DNA mismatch repair endonuclease MutH [Parashewanella spongiae]|uniref:DNA mismatch repair protein MutH n=1 Tax=Parashewanella spongiae TaxID=342950 RepID=A0A3A6U9F7_9GAMM|nr:DNA mismatch repair endonuclease MutH [Parashewanella spongiae]MCL1077636.1 DNA mismatch repair endonuclease MutH [Parashewanella spongiae]RJY18137.1 DNA mismatch repair endonuclease MutH [Parashewanella spongiae]
MKSSPQSIEELLARADSMAGLTFAQLAKLNDQIVPKNLRRDKGWVGQLIEHELGANAGSKSEPDFNHLDVELKTIPINSYGKPLETTFVTVAPLINISGLTFFDSVLFHKLKQVLWVPIEGERDIPVAERRIGCPFLWQPDASQLAQLKQDWEEIMELIALGQVTKVTARHGEILQLRPKAANSAALTESIAEDGSIQLTNPRGFYLKTQFTTRLLANAFGN